MALVVVGICGSIAVLVAMAMLAALLTLLIELALRLMLAAGAGAGGALGGRLLGLEAGEAMLVAASTAVVALAAVWQLRGPVLAIFAESRPASIGAGSDFATFSAATMNARSCPSAGAGQAGDLEAAWLEAGTMFPQRSKQIERARAACAELLAMSARPGCLDVAVQDHAILIHRHVPGLIADAAMASLHPSAAHGAMMREHAFMLLAEIGLRSEYLLDRAGAFDAGAVRQLHVRRRLGLDGGHGG